MFNKISLTFTVYECYVPLLYQHQPVFSTVVQVDNLILQCLLCNWMEVVGGWMGGGGGGGGKVQYTYALAINSLYIQSHTIVKYN